MKTSKNVTTFLKKVTVSADKIPDESSAFSNMKAVPRLMILPNQKSKKDGRVMIYVEITILKQMYKKTIRTFKRIATEIRVLPEQWSQVKEEIKPRHPEHSTLNRKLEAIKDRAKEYGQDKIEDAPYLRSLPNELTTIDKYLNKKKRKNLLEFLDEYIAFRKSNSNRNTFKEFITLRGRLRRYIEYNLKQPLFFEDMTFVWAEKYKSFAKTIKHNPNTVDKTFETLSTFLTYYHSDQNKLGFYLSDDYTKSKFSYVAGTNEPDPSPLYPEELMALMEYQPIRPLPILDENGEQVIDKRTQKKQWASVQGQEKIIKLFLLGCFTGLRFSDLLRLTAGNFQDDFIVVRANKTDKKGTKTLYIPLINETIKLLETISYDINKIKLSNQQANRNLKAVLREVGINTIMKEYVYDLDGGREEYDRYKYEIVTFHSSRDSFITNMLIASNGDYITVMAWSGHKQFGTFQKYILLSQTYLKTQKSKVNLYFDAVGRKLKP